MSWAQDADATWAELVAGLVGLGFEVDESGALYGDVSWGSEGRTAAVEVRRTDGFPFRPPKVRPWDGSGTRSWHQEADGTLCLWAPEGNTDWPWLDPGELVARVARWFELDAVGWPGVPADLDLERYLDGASFPRLVLYTDDDLVAGSFLRLRRVRPEVYKVAGTGTRPKGALKRDTLYGHVLDVGELARPFHDWDELAPLLDSDAAPLERRIRAAQVRLLLVRYARDGEPAVAALVAAIEQGAVKLRAVESADDGPATRRLRAGPGADSLATRRVAVVGIGAVGGFVADLLLRSGVGKLTLVDGERLRPGNCVRHLLGHGYVGWNKAAGVRDDLLRRHDVAPERVAAVERSLSDGEEAETLLTDHDLVVNAAAADLPTGLLFHCAAAIGTTVLSVHLERRGELAVVHRRPLGPGRANFDLAPDPHPPGPLLREGGCGEPVSPTPPNAVVSAAGLCARLVTTALVQGPDALPTTVVDVLVGQPDEPFGSTGIREFG